jgi:hypothetical protein
VVVWMNFEKAGFRTESQNDLAEYSKTSTGNPAERPQFFPNNEFPTGELDL